MCEPPRDSRSPAPREASPERDILVVNTPARDDDAKAAATQYSGREAADVDPDDASSPARDVDVKAAAAQNSGLEAADGDPGDATPVETLVDGDGVKEQEANCRMRAVRF